MVFSLFGSKKGKLKKLIEEDNLHEALNMIEKDMSLIKYLTDFLRSNNPKLKSNSIYLATRLFLKKEYHNGELIKVLKEALLDDDENVVLDAILSLKSILKEYPEYYEKFENELNAINKRFVNLLIREDVWELINKYGKRKDFDALKYEKKLESEIQMIRRTVFNSRFLEKLRKALFEFALNPSFKFNIDKLEVSSEMLDSKISKNMLSIKSRLLSKKAINNMDPLTLVSYLVHAHLLPEENLKDIVEIIFKLLDNPNDTVRNAALNTLIEICKKHPHLIYNHLDKIEKYVNEHDDTLSKVLIRELSKHYELPENLLSRIKELENEKLTLLAMEGLLKE